MMASQLTYEPRVVAFVDILGFRAHVGTLGTDPTFQAKLHSALAEIKSYKSFAGTPNTSQAEVEVSVFSDNIVISAARDQLFQVIWSAVGLQCRLLALGILCRGGISQGRTFHKDDFLYGEGMVRAYELESKTAIYPRIVIDPQLASEISPGHKAMLLSEDVDGLLFIDPFAFGVLPLNSQALLEDAWDPHLVFLEEFAKRIDKEIESAKDPGIYAKWSWMKSQSARALAFHQKHKKPRMWVLFERAKAQG